MEKINLESLSKIRKTILVFGFFIFLIILSVIWGVTSAQTSSIPIAPTNLSLNGTVTSSSVPLNWNDNANNEDKFNVERKLTTTTDWSGAWSVQLTTANTTTYTDTTVTAGSTYDYRIQACLSGTGCSDYAYLIGTLISTNGGGGGGATCTGLILALNDGKTTYTVGESVNYTWTCSPGGTASNVSIWLQNPDGTSVNYNSGSGSGTQMGFSTSNLVPGSYVLKACFDTACATVNANQSFTVTATKSGGDGTTTTIPATPTNLTVTVSGSNVTLNWTDNSSNESGFKIYRGPTWTDIGNVGANITTFIDSNRPVGTYTYHINAFNSSNVYSPVSNDVSASVTSSTSTTTPTTTVPTGSTSCTSLNLTLNDGKTAYTVGESVNYTWTCSPGSANNVSIYLQNPDGTSTLYNSSSGSSTQTMGFSTSNLISGTYILKACFTSTCTTVNASQSFVVTTTTSTITTPTTPTIPHAPTNLLLNKISTSQFISIYWTDNANNEDKFNIERKLSSASTWPTSTLAQIQQSNITTYIDTTSLSGIIYDYRVQACLSGTGCSNYAYLTRVLVPASGGSTIDGGTTTTTTSTPTTTSDTPCTRLSLTLNDGKTTYTVGESVNYTWTCSPGGSTSDVSMRLQKPDGTSTLYNNGSGNSTLTMGFSTSNFASGTYILKACFTSTCATVNASRSFTVVSTSESNNINLPVSTTTPTSTSPPLSTQATHANTTIFEQINILQNKLNNTTDIATQASLKAQISALQSQVQISGSNQIISQGTTTTTTTPIPTPAPTTNVFSSKVQDLGFIVEDFKMAVGDIKEQLIRTINESVDNIINNIGAGGQTTNLAKINNSRDQLLLKVDAIFGTSTIITSSDLSNLKTEINKRISEIKLAAGENLATTQTGSTSTTDITNTLNTLSSTINNQSETLKNQGGDLLYKDTNKDGISDYDSVYVYNMSPTTPSPVSTYEGKSINASDKILLGFDPTKSDIVKVEKQQPVESTITPVSTYKVSEVVLTDKKQVSFKGQALPNSFITIYIYSTPIMVTVKTDSNGEWQYVLDKELDNGDHTVYTASVNNSGNIIAKSSGFLFIKTAEAATLREIPIVGASVDASKPGLLAGNSLSITLVALALIIIMILTLTGITSKKNKEKIEEINKEGPQ